ncbi:hypothetical protein NQ315_017524 [Exocentrus adspersus]|uniref:Uncharacterized protein n=1 Tax=Exocentrus adspersus TaxID=1586481 RepID=A0AAV8VJL6_9CUCU|nr:hypothetical protein NQ315_017524 [Exocentrus adspersus]
MNKKILEPIGVPKICFQNNSYLLDRHKADLELEEASRKRVQSQDTSLGEKTAALFVANIMKAKRKLGMGVRLKKKGDSRRRSKVKERKGIRKWSNTHLRKRKRVIPPPPALREGGFLPLLLPILGALGGGVAGIVKAVHNAKANKQQLEEQQRHNLAMEKAYKKLLVKLPQQALTNIDFRRQSFS